MVESNKQTEKKSFNPIIKATKTEKCFHEYEITVPYAEINDKVDQSISEKAKTFNLPGFRKGAVPVSIVKQRLGKDEVGRVVQECISFCMFELFKLATAIEKPDVKILSLDPEKGLSFSVSMTVVPEIESIDYSKIESEKIEIPLSSIPEERVKARLSEILSEFGTYEKSGSNYKAAKGDKIVFDYEATSNGKPFDGSKDEGSVVILGNEEFLKDFDNHLIGIKQGETKKFTYKFPEDYAQKDLAKQQAEFSVHATEIQTLKAPATITPEILSALRVESEEKLLENIKHRLLDRFVFFIRLKTKHDLFKKIAETCKIDLPQKILDQDFEALWNASKDSKERGKKSESEWKKECAEISKQRVKISIILVDIAKKNNIYVTSQEIDELIKLQIQTDAANRDKILEFYKDPENREKAKIPMLQEKVTDWILSKAKVKTVSVTYDVFEKDILPAIQKEARIA